MSCPTLGRRGVPLGDHGRSPGPDPIRIPVLGLTPWLTCPVGLPFPRVSPVTLQLRVS